MFKQSDSSSRQRKTAASDFTANCEVVFVLTGKHFFVEVLF